MHTDLKQVLVCLALLLAMSGCQSGAGSGSWKWWGGAQKPQPAPQSALAGSPYDGVELPSVQVEPPSVEGAKPEKKQSLATLPPGTPTPDAYVSTTTQAAHNASATTPSRPYPSTSASNSTYPSTPYPSTSASNSTYPSTPYPQGPAVTAEGSPTSPSKVAGLNPNAQQPSYPSTSFGPEVASSGTKGISSMDTYPLNQPGKQVASTSLTKFDSTPPSNSLGPRYNTSVGSFSESPSPATNRVVPPQSAGPATVAPASQSPLGPRYASLPDNNGPRFDARPAPPAVGGTNVSRPQPPNGGSTPPRYPQSRAPSTAPAYPATTPTQTPTNPFQPGSTTRYVPEPPPAVSVGQSPSQPQAPYNPPPTVQR